MAEPDVRPPGAASPSGKSIYVFEIPLAAMAAGKRLQKLYRFYRRTTWRMDLRQFTVYEHFGWVNIRATTFLFVDQSSSRRPVVRIPPLAPKL